MHPADVMFVPPRRDSVPLPGGSGQSLLTHYLSWRPKDDAARALEVATDGRTVIVIEDTRPPDPTSANVNPVSTTEERRGCSPMSSRSQRSPLSPSEPVELRPCSLPRYCFYCTLAFASGDELMACPTCDSGFVCCMDCWEHTHPGSHNGGAWSVDALRDRQLVLVAQDAQRAERGQPRVWRKLHLHRFHPAHATRADFVRKCWSG
jgi:hypothetical protein